jgi:hypothetical protein
VNSVLPFPGNGPGTGCSILLLYYLYSQLAYSVEEIIAAEPAHTNGVLNAIAPLRGVYQNLARDNGDPFPTFKQLLDTAFPPRPGILDSRHHYRQSRQPIPPWRSSGVALIDNGDLLGYRHDGRGDGSFQWAAHNARKVRFHKGRIRKGLPSPRPLPECRLHGSRYVRREPGVPQLPERATLDGHGSDRANLSGTILRDHYLGAIAHCDAGQDRSAVSESARRNAG